MANRLSTEKKTLAVSLLCEGNSIRSIERVTGVHRDTIMRLGVRVGNGCKEIANELFQDLDCQRIEADELWGFIGAKQKTVKRKNLPADMGDVWTWVAIDADTKLVPTVIVGKRDQYHANEFMYDLASRVNGTPQIDTDGLAAYADAIERGFGCEASHASVIKTYSDEDLKAQRRYSPPKVLSVKKVAGQGNPDLSVASTSYVERQNLTTRMHVRRLTRLTNAFSKKRENFEAAIALHYLYYNTCLIHRTLRCTPAMEAGVVDSLWTVGDIVERIEG